MEVSYRDKELKEVRAEPIMYNGFLARNGTSDKRMIRDCINNYNTFVSRLTKTSRVLDLGANIGALTGLIAADVELVVAVEPDKFNCVMIKHNAPHANVRLLEGCVVPDDQIEVVFEIIKSARSACSGRAASEKRGKDRIYLKTPAFNFTDLVHEHNINAIKIDIEGGEYGILDKPIPEQVKLIAGELHGMSKANNVKMLETIKYLEDTGWTMVEKEIVKVFSNPALINFVYERE